MYKRWLLKMRVKRNYNWLRISVTQDSQYARFVVKEKKLILVRLNPQAGTELFLDFEGKYLALSVNLSLINTYLNT